MGYKRVTWQPEFLVELITQQTKKISEVREGNLIRNLKAVGMVVFKPI